MVSVKSASPAPDWPVLARVTRPPASMARFVAPFELMTSSRVTVVLAITSTVPPATARSMLFAPACRFTLPPSDWIVMAWVISRSPVLVVMAMAPSERTFAPSDTVSTSFVIVMAEGSFVPPMAPLIVKPVTLATVRAPSISTVLPSVAVPASFASSCKPSRAVLPPMAPVTLMVPPSASRTSVSRAPAPLLSTVPPM